MKCYIAEDLLPEYVEELCSPQTRQELEEHLQSCNNCRKKLEEMREDDRKSASGPEDLQPFKKIKSELRKNQIKKVVAIVLLIIVCAVFGTLTVGQIFPRLSCPSYDSLMYRYKAKQIAKKLVDGEIREVLNGASTEYDVSNSSGGVHEVFFHDIAEHLTELHENIFKNKDITVHVDNVTYFGYDETYLYDSDAYNPEMWYRVMLTLSGGEKDITMRIDFDSMNRYTCGIKIEETQYDTNYVNENIDQNPFVYSIQEMDRYLCYYRECTRGTVVDNQVVNGRLSAQNFETMAEEDGSHAGFYSLYFTEDCARLGVLNEETGYTDYETKVGLALCNVFKRCQSNDFQLTNHEYNEAEKKYNATLYWRLTDLSGKECIMMKKFYFGATGYEPVDDKETIYSDDGFDYDMIRDLKDVFD